MTKTQNAKTEVEAIHRCGSCDAPFELRSPAGGWTPEQVWCGVWYDHPASSCGQRTGSVLYPSAALLSQNSVLA